MEIEIGNRVRLRKGKKTQKPNPLGPARSPFFFPPAAQLAQRSLPSSFPVWASPGPWPTQHFPRSSQCPAPPRDRSHHPGPTSPQPFSTQRPSNARPCPTTREARSTTRLTRRANLSAPLQPARARAPPLPARAQPSASPSSSRALRSRNRRATVSPKIPASLPIRARAEILGRLL